MGIGVPLGPRFETWFARWLGPETGRARVVVLERRRDRTFAWEDRHAG